MTKVRAVLQRRWPLLVAATVLGVLAGVASAMVGPGDTGPSYRAEQVLVATVQGTTTANVVQDSLKVSRGEVPVVAAELLGESGSEEELAENVQVEVDEDSDSITIRATDSDPQRASDVVQAFSEAFLQVVNAELQGDTARQLEQLEERVADAEARLETFDEANASVLRPDVPVQQTPALDALIAERRRLADALTAAEQQLTDFQLDLRQTEAYTTLGPERPQETDELLAVPTSLPVRAGLLGVVGLLLGVGLVVLVERVNRRIDTREELASMLKVPIIAEVGHLADKELPTDERGRVTLDGVWSEHYRRVRSAIQFVQSSAAGGESAPVPAGMSAAQQPGAVISGHGTGRVPRVFMFVSAMPGEGKSTSAILTGMALAETGDETIIVNADFRRPSVERYLGARTSPSLEDMAVMSPTRPSVDELVQHTGIDHLWLAAAGPPTLEVEGRLHAARELALEAARRGGTVLIDSSPLRVTNDPIDLLPVVDEVVLVVRAGQSTAKSLQETLAMLDMHHAPVLGVILIGTGASRETYSYYGTYYDDAAEEHRRRSARRLVPAGLSRSARPSPAARSTPPATSVNGHGWIANQQSPTPRESFAPAPQVDAQRPSAVAPPPVGAYARPRPPADEPGPQWDANGYEEYGRQGYVQPPHDAPPPGAKPSGRRPGPPSAPPPYRGGDRGGSGSGAR